MILLPSYSYQLAREQKCLQALLKKKLMGIVRKVAYAVNVFTLFSWVHIFIKKFLEDPNGFWQEPCTLMRTRAKARYYY